VSRLIALLCLVALAGPGAASAGERDVAISGLRFVPQIVNVIIDDTVLWTNKDSSQPHDVWSSPAGAAFKSGLLDWNEEYESPPFTTLGDVAYFCHEHLFMTGTVRVREIWLSAPSAPVLFGNTARLNGLAPEGTNVDVERLQGGVWTPVQTVTAGAEDVFSLTVPTVPAQYRATMPTATSATVTVVVKPRVALTKRRLPRKRTRVTVTATPNRAGAVAVLQRKKPAGWAAIASKRLGTGSKAAFVVRPPKGTWRVRAIVKASGGYAAGQSAVIAVKR
jgi:plastocyanin